jgi:transketolase
VFATGSLSLGMAEQNMMSFAGGLAREGFHPYIHTFAVFLTRRPFDQVAMSIGVPNLPVRMLGFLPGLTTPGGVTHQAIDDIALMRSIPNIRILECGDATEVESVLDVAESINGPVYIRMLRGEVPRFFPREQTMKFGQARILSQGDDLTVVSAGICTEEAISAVRTLKGEGICVTHIHISSIVPFPAATILKAARSSAHGIVSMENHSIVGGIGSAIAETLAEAGVGKKLIRLGIPGVYAHGASRPYLLAEYGLNAEALIQAAENLVDRAVARRENSRLMEADHPGLSAEERPEDL